MKDLRTEVHDALEIGDNVKLQKEQLAWRQRARRVWSQFSLADPEGVQAARKRHRVKTYEWLLATDHQLFCSTGLRWQDLAVHEDPAREALRVPGAWSPCRWTRARTGGEELTSFNTNGSPSSS